MSGVENPTSASTSGEGAADSETTTGPSGTKKQLDGGADAPTTREARRDCGQCLGIWIRLWGIQLRMLGFELVWTNLGPRPLHLHVTKTVTAT